MSARGTPNMEHQASLQEADDFTDAESFDYGKEQDDMDYVKLFTEDTTGAEQARPGPAVKRDQADSVAENSQRAVAHEAAPAPSQPQPKKERPLRQSAAPATEADLVREDFIVVLNLMAGEGDKLSGMAIARTAEAIGMRFAKGIFSYYDYSVHRQTPVFRMANMLEPGTFDPDTLNKFSTPGITFFMQVPGVMEEVSAFSIMLDKAKQLAVALNAQIYDERRCTLSKQGIEHIVERIREHQRKMKLAQRHG